MKEKPRRDGEISRGMEGRVMADGQDDSTERPTEEEAAHERGVIERAQNKWFELTGHVPGSPYDERTDAFGVFASAVLAVTRPTPRRRSYVQNARAFDRVDPRRLQVNMLDQVDRLGTLFFEKKTWRGFADSPGVLRTFLVKFDHRFGSLPDGTISDAVSRTKAQLSTALAEISLACGAFDYAREANESHEKARKRVANRLSGYKSKEGFEGW